VKRILSLAAKYANALFFSLPPSNREQARSQLQELSEIASDVELSEFLFDPTLSAERKETILLSFIQKPLDQIERLVSLLVSMKRLELLADIENSFGARLLFESNRIDVEIDSPVELGSEERENVLKKVRKITGMEGVLKVNLNPNLIAGYVIRFRDEVIDTSLSGRLKRVSQELGSGPREVNE